MKIPTDAPVFKQIRIENTNLCGYKCIFCPREKMGRKKGIQSVSDFNIILDRIDEYHTSFKYSNPIHLHGYGEPLLDKTLPDKVKIVTERFPDSISHIVTTLGHNVSDDYLYKLIDNGIKSISVSFYGSNENIYKYHTVTGNYNVAFKNLIKVAEIRKNTNKKLSIVAKTSMTGLESPEDKTKTEFNKMLNDLGVRTVDFPIHNYGDGRSYVKSRKLLCRTLISRDVLQITWDMKVIPCCYDYNAELIYGNLKDNSVKEIFESEQMQGYLKNHCEGKADMYNPCKNCTDRNMKDKP